MMKISPEEEDALIEIGNVGMSKAAKQLSILLNSPIKIVIPKISFMSLNEIVEDGFFDKEPIYSLVSQSLSTDLNGAAALVFKREHANLLTTAVIGVAPELTQDEARACEQEAMLEIGNIIITTCISVISRMLAQTVHLSLPVYYEDKVVALLTNLCMQIPSTSKNFIAITTQLDTPNNILSGHLFLILTEESAHMLLDGVRRLIGDGLHSGN